MSYVVNLLDKIGQFSSHWFPVIHKILHIIASEDGFIPQTVVNNGNSLHVIYEQGTVIFTPLMDTLFMTVVTDGKNVILKQVFDKHFVQFKKLKEFKDVLNYEGEAVYVIK